MPRRVYAEIMRYSDGGGLTAEGRARREKAWLQAAQMFEQDMDPVQAAKCLRVSTKSAHQWRRCWRAGGEAALISKGPGGNVCKLDDGQLTRLRAALDLGPAAHGWKQDQRWTLARVTARPSATRRQSPPGGLPLGRRYEASGGDRGVDLLRGRGRADHAAAEGSHLGPLGPDPRDQRVRQGLRPGVRGRACLPEGWRARPDGCSTGCASTGGTRASAAPCPKPITLT